MREVHKITINPNSEFWKSVKESANLDAEKAASAAADRARKEVLARAEKQAAERKAYLDSIKHYDKIEFKTQELRDKIEDCIAQRNELSKKSTDIWYLQEEYRKKIQTICTHEMVIERRTSYRDEYDDWHEGHYERKCIECFLEEKSEYSAGDKRYGKYTGDSKYHKLENSQVVLLRKTVNGKEYELEFDDLKW